MCLYHNFFIHSYVNGHLGCFRVLAIANTGAMNMVVHVYFGVVVFSVHMPSSGIAGNSAFKWEYLSFSPLPLTSLFSAICSEVKVIQSFLTLCNPMGYTVHGVLQARILDWVAFPFSRGFSQPRDQIQVSHIAGGFFTS